LKHIEEQQVPEAGGRGLALRQTTTRPAGEREFFWIKPKHRTAC